MLFKNEEDSSLELQIVTYELPAYEGDPNSDDRNWLVMRASWKEDGHIVKDSNSCLLTYELKEMTAGLKVLNAGIKDTYASMFQEPYFSLAAAADKEDGGFRVNVSFYLPNTMDGNDTAEITAVMSHEELSALTAELDELCTKYPDRK